MHHTTESSAKIPNNIVKYVDNHRAEVHKDPAVLEEVETVYNDEDNEYENDDDDDVPEISDREADREEDSEDYEEKICAEFKRANFMPIWQVLIKKRLF